MFEKKTFDIHRRAIHYNVSDYVLKRLTGFPSKLSALYSHSMIIIKQRHPTYFIQDPNDEKLFQAGLMNILTGKSDDNATMTDYDDSILIDAPQLDPELFFTTGNDKSSKSSKNHEKYEISIDDESDDLITVNDLNERHQISPELQTNAQC
ncbi:unnamed protein product [Rotaria sp. Silwood1]|nr:unnamed protein product [Rotaria sp. Silwood1]CAF5107791.1 unnamed protein product [Rotaria sp. Silwood1]